ncbi:leucyl/phenylalanyl-tRNA--protein transferase [Afifella sp. IM 167]|uniref:leucyl/phenylalanyl-tRNA--protein transferase n=1 Tax=Afifella sp. IM 167 TaxID=2033586 RepID=UPI001CCC2772|nr:leucyl/phenylalanyl-tRNA--protein transferase [Afifella sp. IM 167]MBZ8132825.1 leucyl/phenylalanyl-tRNA--protein transferase [Afifella sp. IM 167]
MNADALAERAAMPAGPPAFSENAGQKTRRWLLGIAWSLKNDGPLGAARIGLAHLQALISSDPGLPAPDAPRLSPTGAVAVARDLSVPTLREAYRRGLYPLSHVLAPKWLSPSRRAIVRLSDFHLSKRLRSHIRKDRWRVTFDTAFGEVMEACAEPRPGQTPLTWITPQIMRAFQALHEAGDAHSFEVWDETGALIGGGYGVATGRCFTIESQFFRIDNASKVGFAFLAWHLNRWGFALIDNKRPSDAVARFGFDTVPRAEFLRLIGDAPAGPVKPGRWSVEAAAEDVAALGS